MKATSIKLRGQVENTIERDNVNRITTKRKPTLSQGPMGSYKDLKIPHKPTRK